MKYVFYGLAIGFFIAYLMVDNFFDLVQLNLLLLICSLIMIYKARKYK